MAEEQKLPERPAESSAEGAGEGEGGEKLSKKALKKLEKEKEKAWPFLQVLHTNSHADTFIGGEES
jgi:hypothetical protein